MGQREPRCLTIHVVALNVSHVTKQNAKKPRSHLLTLDDFDISPPEHLNKTSDYIVSLYKPTKIMIHLHNICECDW